LMQISGRAARNVEGKVIFYADHITDSMRKVIDETNRRRKIQHQFNLDHGIQPTTIYKSVKDVLGATRVADEKTIKWEKKTTIRLPREDMVREEMLEFLEGEMRAAATNLEFERAAELRDEIQRLKDSAK